ncbi:hypothetical protein [Phytobacter sp. RSE-02]|uniref:hypothetical protein n=1 Tax=Phytobacter sp. RSE-02 TaxID=3229229 RepID=UPI00339D5C37
MAQPITYCYLWRRVPPGESLVSHRNSRIFETAMEKRRCFRPATQGDSPQKKYKNASTFSQLLTNKVQGKYKQKKTHQGAGHKSGYAHYFYMWRRVPPGESLVSHRDSRGL